MDPVTGQLLGGIVSGFGSDNAPKMAMSSAYGAPVDVSVGGLTVEKKPDWPMIGAALFIGVSLAWMLKK